MTDLSNWAGCQPVEKLVLEGRYVRLVPLETKVHGDELFAASSLGDAVERFAYLPEHAANDRGEFQTWLEKVEASADPLYFAVIDQASGKVAGRQTFLRTDAVHGVTEIGHIYWSDMISKTPATTEALYLFAKYAFDTLGYRRFEWKCNNANEPSKRAALRYGMSAEGVHRQVMVVKGQSRDTAWFSMLDHEWPLCRQAFEIWLAPENFDDDGQQVERLEDIRSRISINA